jgi:2-polyprenyl-3-methyl-5-hydroxy-6-metoxy-1,4-benzoquinol methylase
MAPDIKGAIHVAQWECSACHLLCSYPRAAASVIARYYAEDYYTDIWSDPAKVWRDNLVAYDTEMKLLSALLPGWRRGGRALDVGCGYGVMMHLLDQQGYDVVGCEMGIPAALHCRDSHMRVVRAAAPELPFAAGCFELVVSSHVIEHVLDPAAFVDSLVRVAAPGGAVVIITDHRWTSEYAYKRLAAQVRGRVPSFYTSTDHTFVFAPEHVRRLLHAAGCAEVKAAAFTHVPPGERWHWRAYKTVFRTLDRWRGWGDYMMVIGFKPPAATAARAA